MKYKWETNRGWKMALCRRSYRTETDRRFYATITGRNIYDHYFWQIEYDELCNDSNGRLPSPEAMQSEWVAIQAVAKEIVRFYLDAHYTYSMVRQARQDDI